MTGDTQQAIFMMLVLPAPLGPSKPKHSPLLTEKSIESTATRSEYFLVRFVAVITSISVSKFSL